MPRQPGTADRYSDLFAVGSAIYEIMTGHEPHEHLDSIDNMEEIEALIAAGKFPSTTNIVRRRRFSLYVTASLLLY